MFQALMNNVRNRIFRECSDNIILYLNLTDTRVKNWVHTNFSRISSNSS